MDNSLGSVLVNKGHINKEQLAQAEQSCHTQSSPLAEQLISLGIVSEDALAQIISSECHVPLIELEKYRIDDSVRGIISDALCKKHGVVPLVKKKDKLLVGMVDPTDMIAIKELKFATGMEVKGVVACQSAIKLRQKELGGSPSEPEEPTAQSNSAPSICRVPGQEIYYSHSGATSLFGLVFMPIFGTMSGSILGNLYAVGLYWIPWIYINLALTLGLGCLLGMVVAVGATWGDTRNPKLVGLFGFAAGVFAYYWAWVTWIYLSTEHGWLTSPQEILAISEEIAMDGQWGILGWWPTGGQLKAVWAVEALTIIGLSTLFPAFQILATPYCERCKRWLENPYTIRLQHMAYPQNFVQSLERGDFSPLATLPPARISDHDYTQVEVLCCSKCQQLHTLTLKGIVERANDEGGFDTEETVVLQNLLINTEVHQWLRKSVDRPVGEF